MYRARGFGSLDIVATMPPLPASACTSTQTYIPPGGMFTSGPQSGQVTSTGACQDGTAVAPFSLAAIPWWGWLAAGGAALFLMGGKR
jgi:hypothetical protein